MKRKQALLAAAVITAILAFGLLGVGINAAMNTNTLPISDRPAADPPTTSAAAADPALAQAQAQIAQLTTLINQYQQALAQDNAQIQQLQTILIQLQRAGVITIQNDGTITLGRTRRGDSGFFSGSTFSHERDDDSGDNNHEGSRF